MVAVNDRVIYDGKKATVIQVWRKTVRILTAGMEKMNVPIADLVMADGQLDLIDTARYEKQQAGFTDWEMENGDIDKREKAIAPTETEWIGKFVECRVWPVSRGTIIADYDPYYWLAENQHGTVLYPKGWVIEVDPNSVDPNSIDPNSVDPNSVDPNSIDPNSVDPNQDHPAKGYEEVKTLKGREYRYWRWMDGKKKRSKYLEPVKPLKSPQP
jgi:hypothetical protein